MLLLNKNRMMANVQKVINCTKTTILKIYKYSYQTHDTVL
jgi:hypothetical protein